MMIPDVYLGFNHAGQFNLHRVLEHCISLRWTDRFFDYSDFEIKVYGWDDQVRQDHWVKVPFSDRTMYILSVERTVDAEGNRVSVYKGASLERYLTQRILMPGYKSNGDRPVYLVQKLLLDNAIMAPVSARNFPYFNFPITDINPEYGRKVYRNWKLGDNLFSVIRDVCVWAGVGFYIKVDQSSDSGMQFVMSTGVDRRQNAGSIVYGNQQLYPDYPNNNGDANAIRLPTGTMVRLHISDGTLTSYRTTLDRDSKPNYARVGVPRTGGNAGETTTVYYDAQLTNTAPANFFRHEVYVDAGSGPEGETNQQEKERAIRAGRSELEELGTGDSNWEVDVELTPDFYALYRKVFDLGDVFDVLSDYSYSLRLKEMTTTIDSNGVTSSAVLGGVNDKSRLETGEAI